MRGAASAGNFESPTDRPMGPARGQRGVAFKPLEVLRRSSTEGEPCMVRTAVRRRRKPAAGPSKMFQSTQTDTNIYKA